MFARNFGFLAGGSAVGQLAYIALSPVVTRLYSASEMGLFSIYSSLVLILVPLATMRYEVAIPIAVAEKEVKSLQALCLISAAIVFLALGLSVFLFRYQIASLLNAEPLASFLWLLPFSVLAAGMLNTLVYSALGDKRFSQIARSKALSPMSSVGLQVVSYGLGAGGLIISQFCGRLVGVMCLLKSNFVAATLQHARSEKGAVATTARNYRRYPLFNAPTVLTAIGGEYAPVLFLAAAYSTTVSGYYGLTVLVLALPIAVVSEAIGAVYYASSKENYDNGSLKEQFLKIFEILLAIGMPATFVLVISGPRLFSIVFGPEWEASGEIARFMAVQLLASFVAKPLATTVAVLRKEREYFFFQCVLFTTRLLALSAAFMLPAYQLPIFANAIVGALFWMCFVVVVARFVGLRLTDLLSRFTKTAFFTAVALVPLLIVEFSYGDSKVWWLGLVASATLCLLLVGFVFRKATSEK